MNRDHKIEKINAYRKMLSTSKIPQAKEDDVLATEINAEFQTWATAQLAALLGEGSIKSTVSDTFSSEEIDILKALVAGVKAKRQANNEEEPARPANVRQTPRAHQTLPEAERSRLNANAQPLGNRKMGNSNNGPSDPLLSKLEQMDRDGPEY